MTNKKFKVAAMSMALTACVAAQPLIANAADEVSSVSNEPTENESQSEGESSVSAVAAASEGSSNTEVKAEEQQDMLAPDEHLGKYGEPQTDTDGSSTSEAPITKDAPEQEPEIDGDDSDTDGSSDTDTDGSGDSGSTDGERKEQIPIGESTLTETPGQSSTVVTPNPGAESKPDTTKPPKVTTNPDGSVDIEIPTLTPGTETTTTTASGEVKAESHTKEETPKKNIDLGTELGDTKPDWSTETGTKFNGYKVDDVETSEDGNSKTLTLTKTKHLEGQMGSDELAKFTNSTKKDNGDGTYDLVRTETYTDENGQQRTRTTTLHMKENEVTVDTTITLTVALEKGKHDASSDNISQVVLPDQIKVTYKETGDTKTISAEELERLMGSTTPTIEDAKKTYTVKNGDLEYTIVVDEGDSRTLTNAEIFEKLDSSKYEYDKVTGKIYYTGNGERTELTEEQNNTLRKTLSYTVTVKETLVDGNLSYVDSQTKAEAVEKAEAAAKTEARNKAVENALKELNLNDAQVQQALKDGTFDDTNRTFTYTLEGKTYTLNYTKPTATESSTPTSMPNESGTTDTQQHTVTGTAQVTNGMVSWKDSGSGSDSYAASSGDPWPVPEGATVADTKQEGSKTITTYKVTSEDGSTVTTYVVTEEEVQLIETEKERIAWDNLKERLELDQDLTPEQLQSMGYSISGVTFTGSTKNISWTATQTQTTTSKTEESVSDIIYVDGNKKWTIDEATGTITVEGTPYTISQKNADGSYTCDVIDADNKKTSYTFAEKDSDASLTEPQVRALLVDKLASDFPGITADEIQLSTDGKTASYTKGGKTVTIDYSKLGKELEVKIEEHHTSSTVATIKKDENYDANFRKACQELLDQIKATPLDEGQELWIGNTRITDSTTLTEDLIKYFTKAVSSTDMSKDELIKALQAQALEAHKTDVTVNEGKTDKYGNSYEETLRNYYTGTDSSGTYYVKPDGSVQKLSYDRRSGKYYYRDSSTGGYVYPESKDIVTYNHPDYIKHLDLASGSQLELLPDKQGNVETTDCVLIRNGLKLVWNDDAENLVKNIGNTEVGLDQKISYDQEKGNATGHYEYDRGTPNNKPNKSAFYKLTGTVAYDTVTDKDGNVVLYADDEDGMKAAVNAYLNAVNRQNETYDSLSPTERDQILSTFIVHLGHTNANQTGPKGYQVYKKTSQLEAYGYMTRDANTCVNQTYYRQYDTFEYGGGYDLMISKLIQVHDGMVVGQTSSDIQTITAPWSILSRDKKTDSMLKLSKKTTETTTTSENPNFDRGNCSTTNGKFAYNYTQDHTDMLGSPVTGTGTGIYTSFRKLFTSIFTGNGTGHEDSGSFHYTYRTEKDAELAPVNKVTQVDKTAHITYDCTTVESRDILIPGKDIVHIDPDGGGDDDDNGIIDENTPDSPILPSNPELPPVQDARPDAPVLPSDPVLPPVQDARIDAALPQTGVNWLTAIGLALSGMTLMITGAFASLTGKNAKH